MVYAENVPRRVEVKIGLSRSLDVVASWVTFNIEWVLHGTWNDAVCRALSSCLVINSTLALTGDANL